MHRAGMFSAAEGGSGTSLPSPTQAQTPNSRNSSPRRCPTPPSVLAGPSPTDASGELGLGEACAALRSALVRGVKLCAFDSHPGSPIPSLEVAALNCTVENVLGKMLEYDARAGTDLYQTLKLFLERDRNVKATSIALSIHRQTLVYRLKRIEQITSRSTSATVDLCDFWMAIRAREAMLATATSAPSLSLSDTAA